MSKKFTFIGNEFTVTKWSGQEVGLYAAVDTETDIVSNLRAQIPTLATFQYYDGGDTVYLVELEDIPLFFEKAKQSHLIFHNIAFDWFVIDKYLGKHFVMNDWLEDSRIHDTQKLEQLLHLANVGWVLNLGQTGLGTIAKKRFGLELDKAGEERVTFGQYIGKSVDEISDAHMVYAAKDVILTRELFKQQHKEVKATGSTSMLSEQIQIAGAIGISHMVRCGIGFDLEAREAYVEKTQAKLEFHRAQLANWGVVRGRSGFNAAYDAVIDHLKLPLSKNNDGTYTQKEEFLRPYRKRYSFVNHFLTYMETEKALSFVIKLTTDKIHANYDLLKNTGRTGCSGPNMQNLPRS